jgi:hypothetical protein
VALSSKKGQCIFHKDNLHLMMNQCQLLSGIHRFAAQRVTRPSINGRIIIPTAPLKTRFTECITCNLFLSIDSSVAAKPLILFSLQQ